LRHAFIVAYDGARYFGFVRQPSKPTVEAELLRVFRACGLYSDLKEAGYRVAARTDSRVSAVGQVVALDVVKNPNLKQLNSLLPEDIAVLAVAEVKSDFNPRTQAQSKHYRYVCEAPLGFDLSTARRAVKIFLGVHDFRHFCKHERGKSTMGEISYANVRGQKILVFDFIAPAFLWQQVRRMVWALLAVGTGKLSLDDFRQMIDGRAKQAARPAPAEGLFLVGVRYPSLALRPDTRIVSRFIKHLKNNVHPVYGEMMRLILAETTPNP
jgi:tRNA pseudouridine(38-40) synthase